MRSQVAKATGPVQRSRRFHLQAKQWSMVKYGEAKNSSNG
jgi:hypothetical protein